MCLASSSSSVYLDRAQSTARWISWEARCGNASAGCTFPMNTTEGCCGHEYSLYYGPPGVALFYIQLARATDVPGEHGEYAAMALGAGDRMVATLENALAVFGNNTAMYYGSSGLAFAFRELAGFADSNAAASRFLAAARRVEDNVMRRAVAVTPNGGLTWDNNTDGEFPCNR